MRIFTQELRKEIKHSKATTSVLYVFRRLPKVLALEVLLDQKTNVFMIGIRNVLSGKSSYVAAIILM